MKSFLIIHKFSEISLDFYFLFFDVASEICRNTQAKDKTFPYYASQF